RVGRLVRKRGGPRRSRASCGSASSSSARGFSAFAAGPSRRKRTVAGRSDARAARMLTPPREGGQPPQARGFVRELRNGGDIPSTFPQPPRRRKGFRKVRNQFDVSDLPEAHTEMRLQG